MAHNPSQYRGSYSSRFFIKSLPFLQILSSFHLAVAAFCLSRFSFTGTDAYPSIMDITDSMECGKPTLLSFSAREVSDGTLFKTILDYDPQSKALLHQLEK